MRGDDGGGASAAIGSVVPWALCSVTLAVSLTRAAAGREGVAEQAGAASGTLCIWLDGAFVAACVIAPPPIVLVPSEVAGAVARPLPAGAVVACFVALALTYAIDLLCWLPVSSTTVASVALFAVVAGLSAALAAGVLAAGNTVTLAISVGVA